MSQTAHHHDDPVIPRSVLIGIAVILAFTLTLTAAVSFGLLPRSADPVASRAALESVAEAERMLIFADRADGAVIISEASTGRTVSVIEYGKGGFVRATLRRLAKARAAAGFGPDQPFRLVRWDTGALSLTDPQTGKSAEIYGFGADHVKAFADMLEEPAA